MNGRFSVASSSCHLINESFAFAYLVLFKVFASGNLCDRFLPEPRLFSVSPGDYKIREVCMKFVIVWWIFGFALNALAASAFIWSLKLPTKKKSEIWSEICRVVKRLNVAQTFRYLHKIMLLGDTLELDVKATWGKHESRKIVAQEETQIHNFLLCIHCLFHRKIDGDFLL